jgi:hypothetical protein
MNLQPVIFGLVLAIAGIASAAHPYAAERLTSLTNPQVKFTQPTEHYVVLKGGGITV